VDRPDLMAMMAELSLSGMRAAYDEVMRDGVKRQRPVQQILGDLLAAEMAEKKARSIRYQLGAARLPLARTLAEFDFTASPVNEALVRDLHDGGFLKTQRNAVCIGGTGTGKSHIGIAVTANCVRRGARARFFNVIDLVNRLEAEARAGQWRPKPGPGKPESLPTSSPGSISWYSMNSAICRSPRVAASCCSI
jgi:DNA replication protein DnaC